MEGQVAAGIRRVVIACIVTLACFYSLDWVIGSFIRPSWWVQPFELGIEWLVYSRVYDAFRERRAPQRAPRG